MNGLQNVGSTTDAVTRCCVLGESPLLCIFHLLQSTRQTKDT